MKSVLVLAIPLSFIAASVPALADEARILPEPVLAFPVKLADGAIASFGQPLKIAKRGNVAHDPLWSLDGLFATRPAGRLGVRTDDGPGHWTYDASSKAWYASSAGVIVRLDPGGRLVAVADGVQGIDVDVRAGKGLAVSREPDHTIVLHRLAGPDKGRKTLLKGAAFFAPRFSTDGSRILVAESRRIGGHFWVVGLDGKAKDLGYGYGAVWHPDGRRVVYARVEHDAEEVTGAELWIKDVDTGAERRLTLSPGFAEVEPAVSPDGKWISFANAMTGELFLARMPAEVAP
jgi:hypothetical protein